METKQLRIGSTDVILTDYEIGQGKIIISDDNYGYNFSYYWGSMGSDLNIFLKEINSSYFVNKLGPIERGGIDLKATMKNVRHYWKTECGISWYNYMDEQKTLRQELKIVETHSYDEQDFVRRMQSIDSAFYFRPSMFKSDFQEAVEQISCEPWHHIVCKEHPQNTWLEKFFVKLKQTLTA